jgi:hypothetical protein
VRLRAGHGRHPFREGLPTTGGGVAKKAPDVEEEAHRDCGPGQIGQGPAVAAMAAGRRLRTGGTGGSRRRDLHVQGQALVFEGKSLHLERRGEEASSEVMQRQHRVLLSCVRDDAGRHTIAGNYTELLRFTNSGQEPTYLTNHTLSRARDDARCSRPPCEGYGMGQLGVPIHALALWGLSRTVGATKWQ